MEALREIASHQYHWGFVQLKAEPRAQIAGVGLDEWARPACHCVQTVTVADIFRNPVLWREAIEYCENSLKGQKMPAWTNTAYHPMCERINDLIPWEQSCVQVARLPTARWMAWYVPIHQQKLSDITSGQSTSVGMEPISETSPP